MKNINKMLNNSMNKLKELQEERGEFDKYMEEYRRKSARSQELNIEVVQDHVLGDHYSDSGKGKYESAIFQGTKKQLDDILTVLSSRPHNEIKIIGSSFMEEVGVDHDQVMEDYLNTKK